VKKNKSSKSPQKRIYLMYYYPRLDMLYTHTMLCVDALRNGINGPEPTSPLKKRTRMTHDSASGLASLAYYIYNNGHDGRAIRGTYYGIQQNDVCCRHFYFCIGFFLFSPFTLKRHAGKHRT
jgi:hypothetical protein